MAHLQLVRSVTVLPEDEEIKAIARRDKRAAVGFLVQRYRDRLFQHAAYILKNPETAGDVVQEVFIKAIREPRFFDDEFKMKAWLFRVTSNLCFNLVRDRKRRAAILEATPQKTFDDAPQDEAFFHGEQQKVILAAMDRLTEDHREILTLRYYDDLSYAEIAEVLDVALGTVMSRLSRARGRLMEVLDASGVEAS